MRKETKQAIIFMGALAIVVGVLLYFFNPRFDRPTTLPLTDEDYESMTEEDRAVGEDKETYIIVENAKAELEKLKEAGIIAEDVKFDQDDVQYLAFEDAKVLGDEFGARELDSTYYIMATSDKYCITLRIDKETGKVLFLNVQAGADENAVPVKEEENASGEPWKYYDNYEDVICDGLNVEKMCNALSEYWGFGKWHTEDTFDEMYNMEMKAPDNNTLIKDLPNDNYYMTVYFDGDQENVPMFIQTAQFPGSVCVLFGAGHLVG